MIPQWNEVPEPIEIEKLRSLAATHGQDVAVLVTWHHQTEYNFVTVGRNKVMADAAVRLRDEMVKNLGIESLGIDRDLRHEHPNVKLSAKQLEFLVWNLGYLYGLADKMDELRRTFVLKYHDELAPIIGDAYEKSKT